MEQPVGPTPEFQRLFLLSLSEIEETPLRELAIYMADRHGHGPYIQGYLDAAELVRDSMREIDRANTLLYPGLFLLRHAVELALKEAIAKRTKKGGLKELWRTHNLQWLAETFRENYEEAREPFWDEYHVLLVDWEKADPGGMFFRYCRDHAGNPVDLGEIPRLTAERVWTHAKEAVQTIVGIADL